MTTKNPATPITNDESAPENTAAPTSAPKRFRIDRSAFHHHVRTGLIAGKIPPPGTPEH